MSTRKCAVVGIDLSLTRTAAVYIPANWDPTDMWRGVEWMSVGAVGGDCREDVARLALIANELISFVEARGGVHGVRHIACEDHAYHAGRGGTMAGAELHGAVKCMFWALTGVDVEPINVMTARKLFLGSLMPRKDAKVLVHEKLGALDPPWKTEKGVPSDEGDAFLIANALRSRLGMLAVVLG